MKTTLFFICILITAPFINSQWIRTNGPEGISINSLISVGGTIYAGTSTDGVYASTNDGVDWVPRNSGIETQGVLSLASGTGYLYAGTNGSGVYRSSNNGQNWIAPVSGGNLAINSIVVKDSYIFAATSANGVYRSTDNGATWNVSLPGSLISIFALCVSGNSVYASSFGITYETTNNGVNWFEVPELAAAFIWSFYCSGNLIIAGAVNAIYRSTDHGNTFTLIPVPFSFSAVNIYSIAALNSVLYIATSFDGVYKSTDNGSTWSPSNQGMGPKDVRAITATGSSSLVAGTHYVGVFRSTDNGANWNKSMTGFHAGSTIAKMISVGSAIYTGTRGDGMHLTTDNGASWIKLTGNNDTINYSFVVAMCEKNGVIFAGPYIHFHAAVYKSTDEGSTWIRSMSGLPGNLDVVSGMAASGDNILAAVHGSTGEGLYYSSDDGDSWHPTNLLNIDVNEVAAGGNGYAYAIVTGSGIFKSVNDGISWSLSFPFLNDLVSISAKDSYAYAGTFFHGSIYTINFGNSWSFSAGFPGSTSIFAHQPVSNGLVLAGTDIEPLWIYSSTDYGVTFSPYSDGLAHYTPMEAFAVNDSFMFAGGLYTGVWRRLRPELVSVVSKEQEVPREFRLEQNYPNPFNPATKITYSIPKTGFVSLKIYDMLGREVVVLVDEVKQPGRYLIIWGAADYSSGIYFYKLTSGQFTSTKKMILIK